MAERGRARPGWAVAVVVAAAVLFTMPLDGMPDPDAVLPWGLPLGVTAHLVITSGVALVWGLAFPRVRPLRLLLGALLFAFAAEALQALPIAPDRSVRIEDALTNVAGVTLGWLLAMAVRKGRARREQRARARVSRRS